MKRLLLKVSKIIPDKLYLKLMFYKNIGEKLNLKNPVTYNEKLQWLKLNNRKDEYSKLVDKYRVREYVKEKIGEEYLIPLIGCWENASEINFDLLPQKFVLKSNHDSKGVVICKDKSKFDIENAVNFLNKRLKCNGYWYGREWPYKSIQQCIIAEKFLEEQSNEPLIDYKVLCFNGKAKLVQVHMGRGTGDYTQDFYDVEWNYKVIDQGIKLSKIPLEKPQFLNEMIVASERLAKDLIHARIDWYFVNNQLYFGEITFFDGSGFVPFINKEDDIMLGNWIQLKNN